MDLSRQRRSRRSPEESSDRHSAAVDTERAAPLNAQPPCDIAGATCLNRVLPRHVQRKISVIQSLELAETLKLIESNR